MPLLYIQYNTFILDIRQFIYMQLCVEIKYVLTTQVMKLVFMKISIWVLSYPGSGFVMYVA